MLELTSHVVDLVETGETARVHRLELQEEIAAISPRLIVGKDVYRTAPRPLRELVSRVAAAVESFKEELACASNRS